MQEFAAMVVAEQGSVLQYNDPQVLIVADKAIGREAVATDRWVDFRAVVGTPEMGHDQMMLSKLNGSVIQLHTTLELAMDRVLRYEGRRYGILSRQMTEFMNQPMWRYIAQAEVGRG